MKPKEIDEFFEHLSSISHDQILEMAELEAGQINNVVCGIQRHCFGILVEHDSEKTSFLYINGKDKLQGFIFGLKFKQKDYYALIMCFAYYISLKFPENIPLDLYNTFLYQLRTEMESRGITTVSQTELDQLAERTGDNNPFLFSLGGIEVIPFLETKEFYKQLLDIKDLEPLKKDTNYVYLLLNTKNGYFKIGRSKNPLKREKTLQAEEPDIMLLFYIEASIQSEKILQQQFRLKRVRGEWFQLSIDDLMVLQEHFKVLKKENQSS